jgi:thymidylate synthase (FAD)
MTQIEATYIDHMGDDLRTANSARVSFKKKRDEFLFEGDPRVRPSGRSDEKLIYDLAEEGHIAPFGHSYILFHIKAPIFVARQLVKHKFLRWSEVSRRYVDDEPEFYVPEVWRGRSADKKQGSSDVVIDIEDFYGFDRMSIAIDSFCEKQILLYKDMIVCGVAPEQARMILPQSIMTEWYWSGSLDAFAAMCRLRCAPDTQYESRIVADQISEKMKELFPVSWAALTE